MQKITDVQFRKRVKELGGGEYVPLDHYTGAKCKIRMKHLPCGETRVITASEFLRGGARCQACRKKEQKAKKFKEIKDKLHKKYGDDYTVLDTEYKTLNTKMRVRHNVCGHVISVSMHLLLRQPICSFCHGGVKSNNKKFMKRVKELVGDEYVFLDPYVNSATKIRVRHNRCGYVYKARPNDFLQGYGRCPKCSNIVHRTIESYKKEIWDLYGGEYTVLGEYKSRTDEIKIRHNVCGYVWNPPAKSLLNGHGCPMCAHNIHLTINQLKDKIEEQYGDEYSILSEDYDNVHSYIEVKHNKCGHTWRAKVNNLLYGYGCPYCSQSRGERFVYLVLTKDLNLSESNFKYGYVVPDLKYKNSLHFDFWLPQYRVAIEYDGKQHYKSIEFFDKNEPLEVRQERDKIKNQYCKDNGINLIRIPYTYNTLDRVRDLLVDRLSFIKK